MKVALIGDVHANLPALEAVLEDAHNRGVQAIWNIGDFVGYGAFPEQVVQRLQQEEALSILGNYDAKVLKIKKKRKKWEKTKMPEKLLAFQWAYDNLSESSREYLSSLPKEMRFEEAGKRILLTHGSPASDEEHLGPDTPEERLSELASMADADMIIFGHSHEPFKQKVEGVWFINTGSVGRADDGDPRACYAVMQLRPGFFQLRHYRIEYDVDRAVAAIREAGLPEEFAQMMLQGRKLDVILEMKEAERTKEVAKASEPDAETLKAVLDLAETCGYEAVHTQQVTRLALRLFDEMRYLHRLGAEERFWLHMAGLLHDIGWVEGQKGHHKTSLRIILDTSLLPFKNRERLIIGSIARYHRKALPKKKHSHFTALKPVDRDIVKALAAILRVADGLDRTHQSLVRDLSCEITSDQVIVRCSVDRPAEVERQIAMKKGQLMEKVFRRNLIIECQQS